MQKKYGNIKPYKYESNRSPVLYTENEESTRNLFKIELNNVGYKYGIKKY